MSHDSEQEDPVRRRAGSMSDVDFGAADQADVVDLLRDVDALRAGLESLTPAELGRVLALVLCRLDAQGDSALPNLLRVLADQVDELMADLEQSAKPPVHFYERADGRVVCDWDNHSNTTQCGKSYRDHPTELYGDLILHRLCDGRLVKL